MINSAIYSTQVTTYYFKLGATTVFASTDESQVNKLKAVVDVLIKQNVSPIIIAHAIGAYGGNANDWLKSLDDVPPEINL